MAVEIVWENLVLSLLILLVPILLIVWAVRSIIRRGKRKKRGEVMKKRAKFAVLGLPTGIYLTVGFRSQ